MAQPKKSPTSLRIPEATQARVNEWAAKRGIPRNAAYVELIERGLKLAAAPARTVQAANRKLNQAEQIIREEAGDPKRTADRFAGVQVGPTQHKPGEMLKVKK